MTAGTEVQWQAMMQAEDLAKATGPEPFVTRCQLAELMGVSIATVDRLTKSGMPSVTWGRRTRRYRASVAMRWAENALVVS